MSKSYTRKNTSRAKKSKSIASQAEILADNMIKGKGLTLGATKNTEKFEIDPVERSAKMNKIEMELNKSHINNS